MGHLQHVKNTGANINENQLHPEDERLQHIKNTVTTPIYNDCNIKKISKQRPKIEVGGSSRTPALGAAARAAGKLTRPAAGSSASSKRRASMIGELEHRASMAGEIRVR
jgi:hypothetical protein